MFLDATKKLANKIRQTLKIQQGKNEKSQEQDTTKLSARQQTDLRLRLTQVASQSKRFQEVWSEYNDSQLNFRKKTKENLIKQARVTGQTHLSHEQIEQMRSKMPQNFKVAHCGTQHSNITSKFFSCTNIPGKVNSRFD